jgi:hypothetical protein
MGGEFDSPDRVCVEATQRPPAQTFKEQFNAPLLSRAWRLGELEGFSTSGTVP